LVEIEPTTGRRHQIRRHFKHIAHPLIGDSTHGKGPLNRVVAQWLGESRLWLHASRLVVPRVDGHDAVAIDAPPDAAWLPLLHPAADGSLIR
jgi:tRNA pseudouridine65 synthase